MTNGKWQMANGKWQMENKESHLPLDFGAGRELFSICHFPFVIEQSN